MSPKLLISYRRDDSKYPARIIFDAFRDVLGRDNVFMDIDSIPPGSDFRKILRDWVSACDILIAVIGPGWFDALDRKTGRRRLEDPNDFVRIEIGQALARGIPVVPLLLDGAPMPNVGLLPQDLKELVNRQAEFAEHRTIDADVTRLIKKLRLNASAPAHQSVPPGPTSDQDHKLFAAYLVQRDRVGIKAGAKPGEMMAAMIGERSGRTKLAQILLDEWKSWFDQPEHARPKERVIQLRVSPTSPALVPFASFLNEAVAKLLKEDLGQARLIMPTYLAVGVGESSREGDSVADYFARIRQSLSKNSSPIDLSRPQELVDAVTAAHAYARQRNESFTVQSVLAGPYGPRIIKAVESVCHECALRKTPRILVPFDDSAPGPLRQIIVDLFKAPDKISPNIKRNAVPYEIDFRPDLVTPRTRVQELIEAVRAALLHAQQNGTAATREAVLAGPHGARVRKAFESVCEECRERTTQRIILPMKNVAADPVRRMLIELFKAPSKVSSKIQVSVAFELECRG